MANLITNVNQACADLTNIKNAIIDNGVEIASGTPSSEYAEKIDEVYEAGYVIGDGEGFADGYTTGWYDGEDAGKNELISLHPEKTVSGSYLTIDDVSELPHDVKCKVTGVDNPESVTVTRCGRNLLNPNNLGGGELVEFNGVPCYKYIDKGENFTGSLRIEGCFKENTQYTFTMKQYREETNTNQKWMVYIRYTDGTTESTAYVPTKTMYTFTTAVGKTVDFIFSPWYSGTTIYLDLSVSCLYEGKVELPYETYNGQTITPSADGTVEGMTSAYPQMNIFTNNADVTLDVTYRTSAGRQAEYDAFWDAYQQNGSRTDYRQAFAGYGWKVEIFKPKHDMHVTNGYMMFMNNQISVDLPDTLGVVLDFANSTTLQYTFNSTRFTRIGVVDGRKAGQFMDTFGYCFYLHTIDKIICNDNTTFTNNCFVSCTALANITFEGTIGNSINFQWCPLTKASITNIIEHLSSTATGQTCTFKKSAKEAAFTNDEWAELIADKTNWTFSLV